MSQFMIKSSNTEMFDYNGDAIRSGSDTVSITWHFYKINIEFSIYILPKSILEIGEGKPAGILSNSITPNIHSGQHIPERHTLCFFYIFRFNFPKWYLHPLFSIIF